MRHRIFESLVMVLLLLCNGLSAQTTRGDIRGTVVDRDGAALPGVTIDLESDDLIGSHNAVTDGDGEFKFLVLPPGIYTVTFGLEGFQTQRQPDIRVAIGTTVRLDVTMVEAFSSEILVTTESPLVNTTTSTVGINLSQDFYMDLPMERNYTAVAAVTPGAQDDASGQTFYGSSGAENAYYIDGANTTEIYAGLQGTNLNFEFIDEVQVKTGAYSAEYGHSTGGYLNVITKSGGNEFHGDVFGYLNSDGMEAPLKGPAADQEWGTSKIVSTVHSDFGADLGGYFIRDKLWFFAAYDRVDNRDTKEVLDDYGDVVPGAPYAGDILPNDTASDVFSLKLSWHISGNHSLSASVFGDPSEREGAFGTLASSPAFYLRRRLSGSTNGAVNYDGVFGENVVLSARYATHRQRWRQEGPGSDLTAYSDRTDPFGNGVVPMGWDDKVSGWGTTANEDYRRQQYNADVTWFAGDLAGFHELKLGAEFEDLFVRDTWTRTGPYGTSVQRWLYISGERYCGEDGEHQYYYRHSFWISEEIDPYRATVDDVVKTRFVEAPTDKFAVYLRDRWQPVPDLTLNLGLRWSRQRLYNTDGHVQMDIDDQWAPRVGFVWDVLGNGKSKLFGSWGYFFESIPMNIVIKAFSGVGWAVTTSNFSDDPADLVQPSDGEAPRPYRDYGAAGGSFDPVDPGTRGQYISEAVIGFEYEAAPAVAVGLRFIHRNLDRIIEDSIVADHDWMIGNPGEGLLTQTWDLAWGYAYSYPDRYEPCPDGTLECHEKETPRVRREFTGVELTVHKRFSDNWQALASVMWSRLEGNHDGLFQSSTWQLSPNWNSAYDYADLSVNNEGLLSNDRPWQLKLDGIYRFGFGLNTGLSTYYRSGTPMTAMGYMDGYYGWEYYLSERGAFGRTDGEWEADLHFGYPIRLGAGLELNLLLDIFNVFNRQGETYRDTAYTDFYEDPLYQPLDWVTGEAYEPIKPGDVDRPPTGPTWNKAVFWQAPRTIRLGVRLSF